ncbi:hypothetical protein J4Q44_G00289850 [Coregonus suidteri]|uniref:Uncharacterized protein n=1 Tax=Coregonus suidteri TaxID=861788 RepID=A0AAN8KXV4_9TELE
MTSLHQDDVTLASSTGRPVMRSSSHGDDPSSRSSASTGGWLMILHALVVFVSEVFCRKNPPVPTGVPSSGPDIMLSPASVRLKTQVASMFSYVTYPEDCWLMSAGGSTVGLPNPRSSSRTHPTLVVLSWSYKSLSLVRVSVCGASRLVCVVASLEREGVVGSQTSLPRKVSLTVVVLWRVGRTVVVLWRVGRTVVVLWRVGRTVVVLWRVGRTVVVLWRVGRTVVVLWRVGRTVVVLWRLEGAVVALWRVGR